MGRVIAAFMITMGLTSIGSGLSRIADSIEAAAHISRGEILACSGGFFEKCEWKKP